MDAVEIAALVFRLGVGIGALLVGIGVVLAALALRPLVRDTRALARDTRRLVSLLEGGAPDLEERRAPMGPVQSADTREDEWIA